MGQTHYYLCLDCGHNMRRKISGLGMFSYQMVEHAEMKYLETLEGEDVEHDPFWGFEDPSELETLKTKEKKIISEEEKEMRKKNYELALESLRKERENDKPEPVPTTCEKCKSNNLKPNGCVLSD